MQIDIKQCKLIVNVKKQVNIVALQVDDSDITLYQNNCLSNRKWKLTQIRLHKRFLLILLSFWPNWPPFALSLFDWTIVEWYWQKPKSSTILNKSYTMRSCWGKKVFSSLEATFESSLGHNFLRSQWHTTAILHSSLLGLLYTTVWWSEKFSIHCHGGVFLHLIRTDFV